MKQYILAMMATLFFTASACTENKTSTGDNKTAEKAKKVLVAYFSATGTTENVAKKISQATSADLFEIQPEQPYSNEDLNWRNKHSRSSLEMNDLSSRPAIRNPRIPNKNYDIIFIGYPIWWDVAPTIINTFIEKNNFNNITVIPFATSGGSSIDNSVQALKQKYPDIKWEEGKLLNNASGDEIANWIKNF